MKWNLIRSIFLFQKWVWSLLLRVCIGCEYLYFKYKFQFVLTGWLGWLCHLTRMLTPEHWNSFSECVHDFSQAPWRASKSLWPLKMYFSSVAHYLQPVWKSIIHYSIHLLLLMSSWANPLLPKRLKPWKFFFPSTSVLRNLNRIYFGERLVLGEKTHYSFPKKMRQCDPSWTPPNQRHIWNDSHEY